MASNVTFTMIKPDATGAGHTGKIIDQIIGAGFKIKAMKLTQLSKEEAGRFYEVHSERSFFGELVEFITSGPVAAMVISGENAIKAVRGMMGATNPVDAVPGSIRGDFALTIGENIVHGSDGEESAAREIKNFFSVEEIY